MSEENTNTEAPVETVQKVEIVEPPQLSPEERLSNFFQQEEQDAQAERFEAYEEFKQNQGEETEENLQADAESDIAQEESAESEELVGETEHAEEEQEEGNAEAQADVLEISEEDLTLAYLADSAGLDVADIYKHMKVPVTLDDGTKTEITLGEHKDQIHALIKQEREAFSEQAQAVETQQAQQNEYLEHQVRQATALIQSLEQDLTGEINAVDWQKLRTENPGEYSALMSEKEAKVKRLESQKQQVMDQMSHAQQQQQEQFNAQRAERLQHEGNLLLDRIPSWQNAETRAAESAEIGSYLEQKGFTPEEAGSIIDHRFINMARDAMLYNKMDKATPAKKKVVKIAKKPVKPGSAQSKAQRDTAKREANMAKFKADGSVDAAADLFKNLGF